MEYRLLGRTGLEVSWLLAGPEVASVIAGATNAEQVRANAGAADWTLSADDVTELDVLMK